MRGRMGGMDKTTEQLDADNRRQNQALVCLKDEIMSMLHAHPLRQPSIDSQYVINWLRQLYDEIQEGLGEPRHFGK